MIVIRVIQEMQCIHKLLYVQTEIEKIKFREVLVKQ